MNQELSAFITPNGVLLLEWVDTVGPVSKSSRLLQEEIFNRFDTETDSWLLFLGFCDKKVPVSKSLDFWRKFTGLFTRKLCQTPELELFRHQIDIKVDEDELDRIFDNTPMMAGAEYLSRDLLSNVWFRLNQAFKKAIKAYSGTVEDFIKSYSPDVHLVGRVFFHLVENKGGDEPFAFLATYSIRLNQQGQSKHLPLRFALQEYENDQHKLLELLSTVHVAAAQSKLVSDLVETGELFHPLAWSSKEAFTFLKEIPVYENAGILCRIPNWWKNASAHPRLNMSIGNSQPAFVGMNALLDFNIRLMIGDMEISEQEAQELIRNSEGLAFIKNKWVAVDPEKLRQTLEAIEKAKKTIGEEGFSIRDALRMQLQPEKILEDKTCMADTSVSQGQWLESVVYKLRNPELVPNIEPGNGFRAVLRQYQEKGLNWLYFLHSLGFGACLADDMGLGKTVQLLGFLSAVKSENKYPASLLIIPASLISNWINEIKRFLPGLRYFIAHPDGHLKKKRTVPDSFELDQYDLVITTYALVQRYEWLKSHRWNYVILDEAQAIKNPAAKQTRSIKTLSAQNRIIMTGTPIENRLSDLWSLFDFLNPGLLGNKNEFSAFSKKLNQGHTGYKVLRNIIKPYILRRLKTDKSVISDLPDKVEMKTYAPLSKKQIVLYQNMLRELEKSIELSEGIQRKGLILAALMKCKQLCNHPDQYLGTGEFDEKESGKFSRLREICETIYEKREKVLVFTQFKEMTQPLACFLKNIFRRNGLILHGSIPVGKRKNIIEQFQNDDYVPFMVLSLKAGGVGLNLTQANHVVHFDRWWNPAVENQATDRTFRIGQKKNVVVHKFVTKGTVEEKIDRMLEEKNRLSREVISSTGESWITEMDNNQLIDIFKLTF